ncbi:uncharacterized protein LOC121260982 isoform X1 [Juglans microcarpa x Juglans regia]|uniref:uncharacterized protein LOC121260982 isoform X1 n=1 Tax=Juglans microcarpa x Juglans regia TaxID=2249226 RepID=UPI001B7F12A3|nr:uncharacterized protein LOC121260982 isoform X1 [Juglans microcarpa x Juglans regia]
MEASFSTHNTRSSLTTATLQLLIIGDGEETKRQAWPSKGPEDKHFKSWLILMYALIQGFHMYTDEIFGLNMITGFVGRGGSNKEVIMVDPLEAKRLAAKQMKEIKAKEKFKRRRQIEAINGAWAMIGLTAGLVIEGQTGKSILAQLAGYWSTIVSFFV